MLPLALPAVILVLNVKHKDLLKVIQPLVNLIISSSSPTRPDPIYVVPWSIPLGHTISTYVFIARIIAHQVSCQNLISRPKTRASNGTCHHTWSPASLYSGQWCFVSRSRSNASHQTIWARASNWTSKSVDHLPAGPCQPALSPLNMQLRSDAFHGPSSSF